MDELGVVDWIFAIIFIAFFAVWPLICQRSVNREDRKWLLGDGKHENKK